VAATAGRPRRHLCLGTQSRGTEATLPSGCLDRCLHPGRTPRGLPTNHLGFSPILCSTAERGGEGEKKREDCAAPPLHRADKTEDRSWPTGAGPVATGEGRRHAGREGQGRARTPTLSATLPLHRATGNDYITDVNDYTEPATTTPPTRREHLAVIFSFPSPLDAFL
jgi:hypothetical protein